MSSALDERSPWPYLAPTIVLFSLCVCAPRAWRQEAAPVSPYSSAAVSAWNDQSWWMAAASRSRRVEQELAAAQKQNLAEPDLDWLPIADDVARKPVIPAAFPQVGDAVDAEVAPVWGQAIAPYTKNAPELDRLLEAAVEPAEEALEPAIPPAETPPADAGAAAGGEPLGRLLASDAGKSGSEASAPIRLVASESAAPREVVSEAASPLLERYLARLASTPQVDDWKRQARTAWARRGEGSSFHLASSRVSDSGGELRLLAEEAYRLSQSADTEAQAVALRRACDAVLRRAEFVELVAELEETLDWADQDEMLRAASAASRFLGAGAEAERWRSYLLLDEIVRAEEGALLASFASTALQRAAPDQLTLAQARFLQTPVLSGFAATMLRGAQPQAAGEALLQSLEAYEEAPSYAAGRAVAMAQSRFIASNSPVDQRIGERLALRYRNANFRVAVHESLLNRVLPQETPVKDRVRDVVVGVPVRGRSTTYSQLHVDLRPADNLISADLHVAGQVYANTTSTSGPAQMANRTQSMFFAQKQVVLHPDGVTAWPAEADASSRSRLVQLMTDYDGVPLLGGFVRSVVKDRHRERMPEARRETESKIERRAASEFDGRVAATLAKFQARYEDELASRLKALDP